jgi:hypothetical protein
MASTISAGTTSGTAIAITGDTTGNLAFQTSAGTYTQTMPNGTGNIVVNGVNSPLVSGTAVASTSGTSIDFTSIPSWVKRVTVMFSGVSTNGTSLLQIQIGAGSVITTGYSSYAAYATGVNLAQSSSATTGFHLQDSGAASTRFGAMVLTNITGNTWVSNHTMADVGGGVVFMGGGSLALSGTLDRVRITTVNGTDTFDAGSINIQYE